MNSVIDVVHEYMLSLKAWKVSIFKIEDKLFFLPTLIRVYSQTINLLPPEPKSTFGHLQRGIIIFIESMFWLQQTKPQITLFLSNG